MTQLKKRFLSCPVCLGLALDFSDKALRRVYRNYGPREVIRPHKTRLVPFNKFAKMSKKQMERWDFWGAPIIQQVAKALEVNRGRRSAVARHSQSIHTGLLKKEDK